MNRSKDQSNPRRLQNQGRESFEVSCGCTDCFFRDVGRALSRSRSTATRTGAEVWGVALSLM